MCFSCISYLIQNSLVIKLLWYMTCIILHLPSFFSSKQKSTLLEFVWHTKENNCYRKMINEKHFASVHYLSKLRRFDLPYKCYNWTQRHNALGKYLKAILMLLTNAKEYLRMYSVNKVSRFLQSVQKSSTLQQLNISSLCSSYWE